MKTGRPLPLGAALLASLILSPPGAASPPEDEYEILWSTTIDSTFSIVNPSESADDDVSSFFDQYEFTPNKSSDVPFQLGVGEAAFDLLGAGETPALQFRLLSPTSNLGVSGSDVALPFLNQRADLLGLWNYIGFDLRYRRIRTDELRLFPEPSGIGAGVGSQYNDDTNPNDRFFTERTGFGASAIARLGELPDGPAALRWLAPALALRGGYESREGQRQLRYQLGATAASLSWRGLTQELDQEVADIGGGLGFAPGGLFNVVFDFDYQRFDENSAPILRGVLGVPGPPTAVTETIGFIPDTARTTGAVRISGSIGERARLTGGFQISRLEQVGTRTPNQRSAGLGDNELIFYSGNLGADVSIAAGFSFNAFLKYAERSNDLPRNTALFNPANGTQFDAFLKRWRRFVGQAELVYRPGRGNLVALGWRGHWIDRELDFPNPGVGIPRENALVAPNTRMYSIYGRAALRPLKGLSVSGEIGYRNAPKTGYRLDLDDYVYGRMQASYAIPLRRPIVILAHGQGSSGENKDFAMSGATGSTPLDFEQYSYLWGVTVTASPWNDWSLFSSFFQSHNEQDYALVRSNFPRYFPPTTFCPATPGDPASACDPGQSPLDYRGDDIGVSAGVNARLGERTDVGIAYSFTHTKARFRNTNATSGVIAPVSVIDSDIHRIDLEVGRWLMEGLRVSVGYRFGLLVDDGPLPSGTDSVVQPFDLSMNQHAITLGVTLTQDLLGDH